MSYTSYMSRDKAPGISPINDDLEASAGHALDESGGV